MSEAEEELRALEARQKELEAALSALSRERGIREEVEALRLVVDRLETEVEAARSAAEMEKNVEKKTQAERTYEALEAQMQELKVRMIELSTAVHQARAAGKTDDKAGDHVASMEGLVTNVKKQAVDLKRQAEANLDGYAKSLQRPGESFEASYSRMLETPLGRSMLATLGDAQALATGGPTAGQLDAHRKSLGA
jgi:chromosome segregation ATPase